MGYVNRERHEMILPMTYTIAEAYVKSAYQPIKRRQIDLLCTLRGSNQDPTRLRIRQWVQEYAVARAVPKFHAGELNSESRTVISKGHNIPIIFQYHFCFSNKIL